MSKAAYVSEASSNDEAVLHNEDASHIKVALLKGEPKKTSLNFRNSFCLISPATNMIDNIIHLKRDG